MFHPTHAVFFIHILINLVAFFFFMSNLFCIRWWFCCSRLMLMNCKYFNFHFHNESSSLSIMWQTWSFLSSMLCRSFRLPLLLSFSSSFGAQWKRKHCHFICSAVGYEHYSPHMHVFTHIFTGNSLVHQFLFYIPFKMYTIILHILFLILRTEHDMVLKWIALETEDIFNVICREHVVLTKISISIIYRPHCGFSKHQVTVEVEKQAHL